MNDNDLNDYLTEVLRILASYSKPLDPAFVFDESGSMDTEPFAFPIGGGTSFDDAIALFEKHPPIGSRSETIVVFTDQPEPGSARLMDDDLAAIWAEAARRTPPPVKPPVPGIDPSTPVLEYRGWTIYRPDNMTDYTRAVLWMSKGDEALYAGYSYETAKAKVDYYEDERFKR